MTAVEWLIEQILDVPLDDSTNAAHLKEYVCKISVFNQALEMEKEQIMDAYQKGFTRELGNRNEDSEQYYNETYKSE